MQSINLEERVNQYVNGFGKKKGRKPTERSTSFDYCFNYFQSFRDRGEVKNLCSKENMAMSCFQLGYYLANNGALSGASPLLEKNVKHYEAVIKEISSAPKKLWEIDIDNYAEGSNTMQILEFRETLIRAIRVEGTTPSDSLLSKLMLGVFGNIPAFDEYSKAAFDMYYFERKSLKKISIFYEENKSFIDQCKIKTLDFTTGQETDRLYTKAKIIDIISVTTGARIGI